MTFMGVLMISKELYETIITIVDDRVKEIKVTREEFDDLKKVVKELAEAQKRTEARLDNLTKAVAELVEAQKRTEERLNELAEAQKRTEERLNELAEAQKRTEARLDNLAKTVAELVEAQKRTEERLNELAEAQKRTEEVVRGLGQQVGSLTDKIGYGLEDLARTFIPPYLEKKFGIKVFSEELTQKFYLIDDKEYEIDAWGEGLRPDGIQVSIFVSCKSRLRPADVESFNFIINEIIKKEKLDPNAVIKILFGYHIAPSTERAAKKYNIITITPYQSSKIAFRS